MTDIKKKATLALMLNKKGCIACLHIREKCPSRVLMPHLGFVNTDGCFYTSTSANGCPNFMKYSVDKIKKLISEVGRHCNLCLRIKYKDNCNWCSKTPPRNKC
jgi:hypothetical protein